MSLNLNLSVPSFRPLRRASREACRPPWGSGGEANQVERPAGDITCLACPAHFLDIRFRSFFFSFILI